MEKAKAKLILEERKFREDIVSLVNSYSEIPAFIRKVAVQELYQQLTLLEQQEYANSQRLGQEEIKQKEEKGESEQGT